MTQLRALPLLLVLPLAGCVIPVPVPEGTPGAIEVVLDEGDSCGARDLRQFVGEPASAVEGVRIVGASGTPATVQVIRPGDSVTEDFSPERVNIRTDAAGIVTAIDCG